MSLRNQETEKGTIAGMSKRIQVTLPDRLAKDLERWADYEGRPTANLAAYLIERAVSEAKEAGAKWAQDDESVSSNKVKGEAKNESTI